MEQFNYSWGIYMSILVQIKVTLFNCIPCLSSFCCSLRSVGSGHKNQIPLRESCMGRRTSGPHPSHSQHHQVSGRALKHVCCGYQVLSTNWFALQTFPYRSTLLANERTISFFQKEIPVCLSGGSTTRLTKFLLGFFQSHLLHCLDKEYNCLR